MNDELIHASTHGFLLGLQVAERVNQLAAGETLNHEMELAEAVLDDVTVAGLAALLVAVVAVVAAARLQRDRCERQRDRKRDCRQ